MTSKEYVLSHYPKAYDAWCVMDGGQMNFIMADADEGGRHYFGRVLGKDSRRVLWAWADAARNIKAGKVPA